MKNNCAKSDVGCRPTLAKAILCCPCNVCIIAYLNLKDEVRLGLTSHLIHNALGSLRSLNICGLPSISTRPKPSDLFAFSSLPSRLFFPEICGQFNSLVTNSKLFLLHTSDSGWGVYSGEVIPTGTVIALYQGEVLRTGDARRRMAAFDSVPGERNNYLLTFFENFQAVSYDSTVLLRTNIDASFFGCFARFFNHSCNPTMNVFVHREAGSIFGVPYFVANQTIPPGGQLTFHYGGSYDVPTNGAMPRKRQVYDDNAGCIADARKRVKCNCRSTHCEGCLPWHGDVS